MTQTQHRFLLILILLIENNCYIHSGYLYCYATVQQLKRAKVDFVVPGMIRDLAASNSRRDCVVFGL